jgi:hypothetical protein
MTNTNTTNANRPADKDAIIKKLDDKGQKDMPELIERLKELNPSEEITNQRFHAPQTPRMTNSHHKSDTKKVPSEQGEGK